MTRSNVYAGPAGSWSIRGGEYDGATVEGTEEPAVLPRPAPVAGQGVLALNVPDHPVRNSIREIPIVTQDRSFRQTGKKLFYPEQRAFFEGVKPSDLNKIPFAPDSDMLPIWNPEAFFNVMVVNGVSWPELKVAPALYRLRFLSGRNSRFLWLKFADSAVEVYQIGAEQGFLAESVLMNDLDLDGNEDGTAQLPLAFGLWPLAFGLWPSPSERT